MGGLIGVVPLRRAVRFERVEEATVAGDGHCMAVEANRTLNVTDQQSFGRTDQVRPRGQYAVVRSWTAGHSGEEGTHLLGEKGVAGNVSCRVPARGFGKMSGGQQFLVRGVHEGDVIGSSRAQQRCENARVEFEASFCEGVCPQLPVQIEEGEDGPVGEEGRSERGRQPLLQFGPPTFDQRPRDVCAEDLSERPLRWKLQRRT